MVTIIEPTLVLDKQKCLKNIEMMAQKAAKNNVTFRPHFKTHQSAEVGEWFKEFDVDKITVSSLNMALYFADHGWKDITVAFPVNILEIDKINFLAEKITINLVVENTEAIDYLIKELTHYVNIYIKIDTGYQRTGVPVKEYELVTRLINNIESSKNFSFKGFLAHTGHTYQETDKKRIADIHFKSMEQLLNLASRYSEQYPNLEISIGDTPTCSILDTFGIVNEIRPGNFAFYDLVQENIGSCTMDQIAVAVACPVVAKHFERNEIIIYGGAVHFSKEHLIKRGEKVFGYIVKLQEGGWSAPIEDVYVSALSQEHGTIKAPLEFIMDVNIGDVLGILPVHSCLTANLMRSYKLLDDSRVSHMLSCS